MAVLRYILKETGCDTVLGIHLFEEFRAVLIVVTKASFDGLDSSLS